MHFLKQDYEKSSDEELMTLILKKNELAFGVLYSRYSNKMFSFFYRMLYCDRDKANDFLQDLFLKLIEKPESFDIARKFSPWIYSIATNMCKNEYKKIKTRSDLADTRSLSSLPANINIYDNIDLKSFIEELYHYLDEMNNDHRSAFLLRYGNNLSIKEIAEILDCPEGTIKSRLYYTIKFLSEKLTVYKPGRN
jgi:RNA polymerase sigma-70 factor, ECF subfamily